MPAINFPDAPTVNQLFSAGNRTWQWTGATWDTVEQTVVGPAGDVNLAQLALKIDTTAVDAKVAGDIAAANSLTGVALSSTLLPRYAPRNTAILFGTSLESQNGGGPEVTDPPSAEPVSANGWFNWFNAYTQHSFNLVRNVGVGGETYAQMLARITPDVLAHPSDWVFIGGPVNDVGQGRSAALIIADLDAMLTALRGRRILILTSAPSASYNTTAKLAILFEVNRYIASLPFIRPNVVAVDVYKLLANIGTAAPATGMALDGVHYSTAGALLVGRAAAEAILGTYPVVPSRSATANDSKGVLTNPLVTGGSGWSVVGHANAGSSVLAAYSARPDGFGFEANVTISGATIDDSYGTQAEENISAGRFVEGDVVWGEATIEWSSATPLAILTALGPQIRIMTRLSAGAFPDQYPTPFIASSGRVIPAMFPSSGKVRLRTVRVTVDAGVNRIYFGAFMRGCSAATFKVTDANVFKL